MFAVLCMMAAVADLIMVKITIPPGFCLPHPAMDVFYL